MCHIALEGCINFRDLGGYRSHDGRTVRWRRVFRSGELHLMSEDDVQRLRSDIEIVTDIDLRSPNEVS